MKKKIGLISYYKDPNYGTVYQAYALAKAISNLGHQCEYIQYEPIYKTPIALIRIKKLVKDVLTRIGVYKHPETEVSFLKSNDFRVFRKNFDSFVKNNIPVSKRLYFIDDISYSANEYDLFVVGSDQTWSPQMNSNPHTLNFLSFVDDVKKKRSYAPSIGTTHISAEYLDVLKHHLSTFEFLSCREYLNSSLLEKELQKKVQYVIDPTLLLTASEWASISKPTKLPAKYILVYLLGAKQCILEFAENISKQTGLPLYYVVSRPEYLTKDNALVNLTPESMLYALQNATCVITDSFHGTVFSVNFNTNFYSFAKRTGGEGVYDNDRIMDFLSVIGLQDRFVADDQQREFSSVNFSEANKILLNLRTISQKYLHGIVE